jgi:uncharacterized protein YndB with AHSA1/START domain
LHDLGRFIEGDTVRFDVKLAGPAELVWEYLTNPEALPTWLGDGQVASEVGGKVVLRSGGPVIRGAVKEIEKPRRLAYTWNVYMPGEEHPVGAESVLRFEVQPVEEGTLLTLTHGPIDPEYRSRTIAGWHALLAILGAHLAEEEPPDFMETFQSVHPDYETLYGGSAGS